MFVIHFLLVCAHLFLKVIMLLPGFVLSKKNLIQHYTAFSSGGSQHLNVQELIKTELCKLPQLVNSLVGHPTG